MKEPEINIRTTPGPRTVVRRRPPGLNRLWIATAGIACVIMVIAIFLVLRRTGPQPPAAPVGPKPADIVAAKLAKPASTATDAIQKNSGREEVVEDPTGQRLWSEPTSGPPISLAFVPAGAQCLVHLRPAQLALHPDGERILAALGPWGAAIKSQAASLLGADMKEVDELLIAVTVTGAGKLDACLRARVIEPWDAAELSSRFPNGEVREYGGVRLHIEGDRARFLAPAETTAGAAGAVTFLIVCPTELAEPLVDAGAEPAPLIRDIQRLAERTDADRMATAIVSPTFLQAGGNELLAGAAAPLHQAVRWLAARDATALAISTHWEHDFFLELRATPALNVPPRRLAAMLRERIAAAPDAVEEIVLAAPFPPYGRKVIARLPAMLRALSRYSRASDADGCAVVRAYLPAMAGHNLLMAAELLLTQPRNAEAEVAAEPQRAATIDERLNTVTSLSFSKDSLERALELLAEDTGIEISIDGPALQLDGITKNQSLAIDLRDQPAREILMQILLRANPDRTAAGPGDARQKLVFTIEPGKSGAPGRIIVTTRAAAERRGDQLPAAFLLK